MRILNRSLLLTAAMLACASAPGQTNAVYAWRNFAGQPGASGTNNGAGSAALFKSSSGVAVDSAGNVYVADSGNFIIRKVTTTGVASTLAGLARSGGSADGTGSAARFRTPYGLAVDNDGNVFVADTANHTIRKVTSGGVVTTLAGSALQFGSVDGTGSAARFHSPQSVAVDSGGNVFVADTYNSTIRKVTSGGVVTTLAGSAGAIGSVDGTGSSARFKSPTGVAVDGAGNVYVADTYNSTLRKVTSAGVVTTLAGNPTYAGTNDGTGGAARFYDLSGVAVDSAGNVYVGDYMNNTIRKMTSERVVTTIGGTAGVPGSTDGVGSSARFSAPWGIAVDSTGCLYVADYYNHRIAKGVPFPTMDVTRSAGNLIVSWPSAFTGFALQQNSDAASPSGWQPSGYTISDDGANKSITITSPTDNLFFRLVGN